MLSHLASDQGYFDETLHISELKQLLDGAPASSVRGVVERVRGLKTLLAMVSKGTDVSAFFPDVVRNVLTTNFELKKLVYMFLLHYVDLNADTRSAALLAINSFQKDLQDGNEVVRALALRTLTSFRVDDVLQIQVMAIQTCSRDASDYVRKVAAIAVTKLPRSDVLEDEVVAVLLRDASPVVVGSAAQAFLQVCPDRMDLVHSCFRRMCAVLPHVDEWGQVSVLTLLSRYARMNFTKPVEENKEEDEEAAVAARGASTSPWTSGPSRSGSVIYAGGAVPPPTTPTSWTVPQLPTAEELDSFYETGPPPPPPPVLATSPRSSPPPAAATLSPRDLAAVAMQEDHKLLLRAALPLLRSRNAGVVVAAVSTMWHCGKRSSGAMQKMAEALVRLIHGPHRETRYLALRVAFPLLRQRPASFVPFVQDFFVNVAGDSPAVRQLKLDALVLLCRPHNTDVILQEMESYVQHPSVSFASAAIRAVRLVALKRQGDPAVLSNCLAGLEQVVMAGREGVSAEAVVAIRDLLPRQGPAKNEDLVRAVLSTLPSMKSARARAALLWLAATFCNTMVASACEALRVTALRFVDEASETKLEALALGARLMCLTKTDMAQQGGLPVDRVVALTQYVLALAQYDRDWNVRDQARMYLSLINDFLSQAEGGGGVSVASLSSLTPLFLEKTSMSPSASAALVLGSVLGGGDGESCSIDSLGFLVGDSFPHLRLPEWTSSPTPATTRDPPSQQPRQVAAPPPPLGQLPRVGGGGSSSESSSESSEDSSQGSSQGSSSDQEDEESSSSEDEVRVPREGSLLPLTSTFDAQPPAPQTPPGVVDVARLPQDLFSAAVVGEPLPQPARAAEPAPGTSSTPVRVFALVPFTRGSGLQVDCWFTRREVGVGLVSVGLCLTNKRPDEALTGVRLVDYPPSLDWPSSGEVVTLAPNAKHTVEVLVDFQGMWGPPGLSFAVWAEEIGKVPVTLKAPLGELLRPCHDLDVSGFERARARLGGMNEHHVPVKSGGGGGPSSLLVPLLGAMNAAVVRGSEDAVVRFAARMRESVLVLVTLRPGSSHESELVVNCEDLVLGMGLADELKGVVVA